MGMTLNEYQEEAKKTRMQFSNSSQKIIYLTMGLSGESGEVSEIVKKHYWHNHPIRGEAIAMELGDTLWYLAELADALGYTLQDIAILNLKKLASRYPEGFNVEGSLNRGKDRR